MRRCYADRLVTVQPDGDSLVAVVVNDGATPWSATLSLSRQDFWGSVLAEDVLTAEVPPGTARALPVSPRLAVPADATAEVLVVSGGGHRALWFWADDKDLRLPEPALRADVKAVDGGFEVKVSADSLQRDVALLVDKVDPGASVDDMLVTILAGQTVTSHVRTSADIDPGASCGARSCAVSTSFAHA